MRMITLDIPQNIATLLKTLEDETSIVLSWFHVNEMKSNDDKCKLIVAIMFPLL